MEKSSYLFNDEDNHRIIAPGNPRDTRDWEEYVKDKTELEKVPKFLLKQFTDKDKTPGKPEPSTNLYDYKGPRDRAKPQDVPTYNEHLDTYNFEKPDLYKKTGPWRYLVKEKERDPTEEPQYPDVSLDTKRTARLIIGHLYGLSGGYFLRHTAATLKQIIQKDTHRSHAEKVEESKRCSVTDISKPSEKKVGKFTFRVKAADSPNIRTCILQFLRDPTLKKEAEFNLLDYPVLVGCSCPSFLWWGAQYYALEGKYMFLPMFRPSKKAPVPEDLPSSVSPNGKVNYGRGLNFTICKHLLAVSDRIKTIKIESEDYLSYKPKGPRQRAFNPAQWEKSFGVFSFSDIISLQKKGVVPKALISRVQGLENFKEVEQFLNDGENGWKSWSDKQKIDYVKNLVGHPDLTLYIMLRDYQITGRQSPLLRERLYDTLDTVMQFEDGEDKIIREKPELLDEYAKEKEDLVKILTQKTRVKEIKSEPEKFVTELVENTLKDNKTYNERSLKRWFGNNWEKGKDILHKLLIKFK